MLRDEDIGTVKSSVNMVQLAEQYGFRINRSGFMICPFHGDKHPSMKLYSGYSTKDGYHCYSCGASGDIIRFVCEYENLDFEPAVRRIAGMFSVPISDGAELSPEDRHRIAERRAEQERKRQQVEADRRAMIELSERIRLYEDLMQGARPFGGLWCYLADQLPVLRGEWEERFEAMKKR